MTFAPAAGVSLRATAAGRFLVAKRPLRAVRVNEPLYRLLARDVTVVPESPAAVRALEGLARAGYLERRGAEEAARAPRAWPMVTVVIPVKDRAEELRRCLGSLERVRYPADLLEVIVVDDGSRDESAAVAQAFGARVVASGGRGLGPASARNWGAREARGELLAFIDSDCTASPGWLDGLAACFDDPEVAAVGGRVEGMHCATRLDRYEAKMSSLCLGGHPRSGREGDDTFYLPSCNLLVRRADFLEVGGFREGMHVGEDVDLTWRLRDRGHCILYVPRGWVYHEHRNRLGAFLRRRFEYGTSEALLHGLHPARTKKMAVPPGLAAALGLALLTGLGAGWFWLPLAALVFAADAARARTRFAAAGISVAFVPALLARARAGASLVYYLGYHAVRYYGWPLLLASAAAPRVGLVAAAAFLWVAGVDHRVKGVGLGFPSFLAFYLGEQLAYGAGVFWGCARRRSFRSYRPELRGRMEMSFT